MVGGRHVPARGRSASLHQGAFLDELPEFRKNTLESLRQPLEDGRSRSAVPDVDDHPARFMLIAAMNPRVCGFYGDRRRACRCSLQQIRQYRGGSPGPCSTGSISTSMSPPSGTGSWRRARRPSPPPPSRRGSRRLAGAAGSPPRSTLFTNARLTDPQLKAFCALDTESQRLLEMAVDRLGLSARAYTRILKVARPSPTSRAKRTSGPTSPRPSSIGP